MRRLKPRNEKILIKKELNFTGFFHFSMETSSNAFVNYYADIFYNCRMRKKEDKKKKFTKQLKAQQKDEEKQVEMIFKKGILMLAAQQKRN